jgi:hypothetical protein
MEQGILRAGIQQIIYSRSNILTAFALIAEGQADSKILSVLHGWKSEAG